MSRIAVGQNNFLIWLPHATQHSYFSAFSLGLLFLRWQWASFKTPRVLLLSPDSLSFAVTEVAQWNRECVNKSESVSLLSFTVLYRTFLPSISIALPAQQPYITEISLTSAFCHSSLCMLHLLSCLHDSQSLCYILVQVNQSSSSLIKTFVCKSKQDTLTSCFAS